MTNGEREILDHLLDAEVAILKRIAMDLCLRGYAVDKVLAMVRGLLPEATASVRRKFALATCDPASELAQ